MGKQSIKIRLSLNDWRKKSLCIFIILFSFCWVKNSFNL